MSESTEDRRYRKMGEKADLRQFETGMGVLMEKIQLPGPGGAPLPPQQKQMLLSQFIIFALMS